MKEKNIDNGIPKKDFLTELVDQTNDLIACVNLSTLTYCYVNATYERLLGYKQKELLHTKAISIVHPEDRGTLIELLESKQEEIVEAEKEDNKIVPGNAVYRMTGKDGKEYFVDSTFTLIDGAKKVGIISKDITEKVSILKELEKSITFVDAIAQNIEDGIYSVDLSGNLQYYNSGLLRMLGFNKDELSGMNYKRLCTPKTAEIVLKSFNQVYQTGKPQQTFGWELNKKNGEKVYINTSIHPSNENGQINGFFGTVIDISAHLTDERIQNFGRVCHEIAQPLSIILGNAEMLSDTIERITTSGMTYTQILKNQDKLQGYIRGVINGVGRITKLHRNYYGITQQQNNHR